MVSVPYPLSSTPGQRPGEGEGRLINCYSEKSGDTVYIRRSPGLVMVADTGRTGPRGSIEVNGTTYVAYTDCVVAVSAANAVTVLSGALPGSDGVTFARNNRTTNAVSTPDVVAVRETGGAYVVSSSAVAPYPDPDIPATVNSVDFMDGYFLFTTKEGLLYASQLNDTATSALSFASAESKPDGLVRGMVYGGAFYAMGTNTIEAWLNVGGSPFPLQRTPTVMPIGLLTTMAVAGFELGWDHEPYFVAHDGTVHVIRGYQTSEVSTPDVKAFIAASTVSTLEASVYTAKGCGFWVLSSDKGTWEWNVTTRRWNERKSLTGVRWRGSRTVKVKGRWIVGDKQSTQLLAISDAVTTEAGSATPWTAESSPLKEFPVRVAIPAVLGEFTEADGVEVNVSWSRDGGKTWATPQTRSLALADKYAVRVNRLGLSTHHGLRVRFSSTSAGDFSFLGASVPDPQNRGP